MLNFEFNKRDTDIRLLLKGCQLKTNRMVQVCVMSLLSLPVSGMQHLWLLLAHRGSLHL